MSYEGYEEWITAKGRYLTSDCFGPPPETPDDDPLVWWNSVDLTNGEEDSCPDTKPGAKEQIGFVDCWHKDHYGNAYATKLILYKPVSSLWRRVKTKKQVSIVATVLGEENG